jgi:hypothetical protein
VIFLNDPLLSDHDSSQPSKDREPIEKSNFIRPPEDFSVIFNDVIVDM